MASSLSRLSLLDLTVTGMTAAKSLNENSILFQLSSKDGFNRVKLIIQDFYSLEGDHSLGMMIFYQSLLLSARSLTSKDSLLGPEDTDDDLESFVISEFASRTNYFDLSAGLEEELVLISE